MKIATIINSWHVLFVGGNGKETLGITVKADNHDPTSGRSEFWDINACTFLSKPEGIKRGLELSDEQYESLRKELTDLQK